MANPTLPALREALHRLSDFIPLSEIDYSVVIDRGLGLYAEYEALSTRDLILEMCKDGYPLTAHPRLADVAAVAGALGKTVSQTHTREQLGYDEWWILFDSATRTDLHIWGTEREAVVELWSWDLKGGIRRIELTSPAATRDTLLLLLAAAPAEPAPPGSGVPS